MFPISWANLCKHRGKLARCNALRSGSAFAEVLAQQSWKMFHDLLLGQEPVCSCRHGILSCFGLHGDHQDRQLGCLLTHLAGQGRSIHARHRMVGHQEIGPTLFVSLEGLQAVFGFDHLRLGQGLLDHSHADLPNPIMNVCHDDPRGATVSNAASGRNIHLEPIRPHGQKLDG